MQGLVHRKFAYILLTGIVLLSSFFYPAPAYAWSAVSAELESDFPLVRVWNRFRDFISSFRGKESPQVVITNKGTHQLMMQLAYQLLEKDPAYVDQKQYFPSIDGILEWEGVVVKLDRLIMEGGEWRGTNAKSGGPDAAGKSNDSYHYYNPKLEAGQRGNADTAVENHFTGLLLQMYNQGDFYNRKKPDTDTNKNAAWSAHYLSDVYVPYHTVGIFSGELQSLRGKLSPSQAGPDYLFKPEKAELNGTDIAPDSIERPPEWSGLDGDFTDVYLYYKDRYSGDWFDPWYYNRMAGIPGFGPNTKIGSHQIWEAWAHDNITGGQLYKVPLGYSKDWQNATPKLGSLLSNIEDQAAQAKAFTSVAADETKGNMALYTKSPDAAFNEAAERVATLWRASLTALRPEIEVLPLGDPANPNKYKIRGTVRNVAANETPTGIQMKLTVPEGTIEGEATQRAKPVVHTINGMFEWDITVKDPKSCKLKLEVTGIYKTTPDLGYAVIEKDIMQTGPSTAPAQGSASIDLSRYKTCVVNLGGTFEGKYLTGRPATVKTNHEFTFEGNFINNTFKGSTHASGQDPNSPKGEITVNVAPTGDPNVFSLTGYTLSYCYGWSSGAASSVSYKWEAGGNEPMDLGIRPGYAPQLWAMASGSDACKYIQNMLYEEKFVTSGNIKGATYDKLNCDANSTTALNIHFRTW